MPCASVASCCCRCRMSLVSTSKYVLSSTSLNAERPGRRVATLCGEFAGCCCVFRRDESDRLGAMLLHRSRRPRVDPLADAIPPLRVRQEHARRRGQRNVQSTRFVSKHRASPSASFTLVAFVYTAIYRRRWGCETALHGARLRLARARVPCGWWRRPGPPRSQPSDLRPRGC